MLGDGHTLTNTIYFNWVKCAVDDPGLIFQFADELTPGIDAQAMTPGFSTVAVGAALSGRNGVDLDLDGPGAEQR